MTLTKFTETTYQESIERVDAQNGILYGVKVLGESSRNNRKYRAKGMQDAAPKYEGVKSYIDHPEASRVSEDRSFKDWSGVFRNPRYVEGKGIFADLHLRKSGEFFEGILEAAEKFPNAVGFSHVAEGESHVDGETEIVESIREVFSVDLVTSPATTGGFFESTETKLLRETLKPLAKDCERIRKLLSEMSDAGYMGDDFSLGKDQPADPSAQIAAALQDTIAALVAITKAVTDANKPAPAPVVTGNSDPAADDPFASEEDDEETMTDEQRAAKAEEDKKKQAAFESLQRENAELKASKLLLESGREATKARINALAKCADEKERKELLESWPQLEEGERPVRSPALIESEGSADFDFSTEGSFAARYR